MVSKRQLEANRLNARRSSGPRTQEGKGRTRMNALRHGLTAKSIVIGDEDSNEFEQLQVDLETDLQPATRLERELVGRLAGLLWRLRRVPILEAALVKARQGQLEEEQENERVERVRQEAIRRFEASHGNDMDAIYAE